ESDRGILRLPRRHAHGRAAELDHVPLATGIRADAGLAVEGESNSVLEGSGEIRARAWYTSAGVRDAPELCGVQSAHADEIARGSGRRNRGELRFEPSVLAGMRSSGGHSFSGKRESDFSCAHEGHGAVPGECREVWGTEFRVGKSRIAGGFRDVSSGGLRTQRELVEIGGEGLYGHRLRRDTEH